MDKIKIETGEWFDLFCKKLVENTATILCPEWINSKTPREVNKVMEEVKKLVDAAIPSILQQKGIFTISAAESILHSRQKSDFLNLQKELHSIIEKYRPVS